jgi:hypothetical protein
MANIINKYQTNIFNIELIKYYYFHYIKLNTIGTSSWDGNIIKKNMDKILAINIYDFIKNKYEEVQYLEKDELNKWFNNNMYSFIDIYYQKEINNIKKYIKNIIKSCNDNKMFFFEKKKYFEKLHGNSLLYKLNRVNNYEDETQYVYINDTLLTIFDLKKPQNIKSLQELCSDKIEHSQRMYDTILNISKLIFSNDTLYIDEMSYRDIEEYIKIFTDDYSIMYEYKILYSFFNCN